MDNNTPAPMNDDKRMNAGRVTMLLTMLHQFRQDGAVLCQVLDIDPKQPKADVLRQMVAKVRGLQAQAASVKTRVVYVSGKPKKTPTEH